MVRSSLGAETNEKASDIKLTRLSVQQSKLEVDALLLKQPHRQPGERKEQGKDDQHSPKRGISGRQLPNVVGDEAMQDISQQSVLTQGPKNTQPPTATITQPHEERK